VRLWVAAFTIEVTTSGEPDDFDIEDEDLIESVKNEAVDLMNRRFREQAVDFKAEERL
jgi:hypothetical protein